MSIQAPGPRAAAAVALAVGATALVIGAVASRRHALERFPFRAWGDGDNAIWAVTIGSTAALLLAGVWLIARVGSHPTGWWLLVTGVLRAVWFAGSSWPGPMSPWADQLIPPVAKATLVMAVLPWPMGRLEPRWSRPFRYSVLVYVAVGVVTPFFGFRWPTWAETDRALPSAGGFVIGVMIFSASALVLSGIAPVLLLVAAVRRRSMMPDSVRSVTTLATIGAALLAACEVWALGVDVVIGSLEPSMTRRGLLPWTGDVVTASSYGVVALLLVGGEAVRRRSARQVDGERRIEMGRLGPDTGTGDVADLIGDPSARLLIRGVDDLDRCDDGRSRVEVLDRAGGLVAVVDHDPDRRLSGMTLDALLAAVELTVVRRARSAEAAARAIDLQRIQRDLLDSHDFARRRLERDLHDGVQQRLVALSIEGSMLARREMADQASSGHRETLVASIESTLELARDVMRQRSPAVLERGLAGGLAALQASIPMVSTLDVDGDLDAGHRASVPIWFIACEAVSNVLKHAQANTLGMTLRVRADAAQLEVTDDGIGGVLMPPEAIRRRVDDTTTTVDVVSPLGGGTRVVVRVELAEASAGR